MAKQNDIANVTGNTGTKRETIIEFTQFGNSMRVTAVDAATGTEVTFQAPTNASRAMVERIAQDKLNYVMKRGK